MKPYVAALAVLAVFLLLPHNASAATNTTTTTMTLPSSITAGSAFNAGVQVSYSGGDAYVGTISMYHLYGHTALGGHSGTITVTNPSITFTLQQTISANVIQIPITGISSTTLRYSIGTGNTATRNGIIAATSLATMVAKGSIYLALGSVQETYPGTSAMTFTAGTTYNITLYVPAASTTITFYKSAIYDGSNVYADGSTTPENGYPAISFHWGDAWEESYSGGSQAVSVTAATEPSLLLAYYGDPFNIFYPSFDTTTINPTTTANTLTLSDATGLVGNAVSLTATLSPIESGRTISFYVLQDGYYRFLGSSSTAANGIASRSTSFDAASTYAIQAVTTTGSYLSDTASVTIDKHPMVLSNLLAQGGYNDLGTGFTTITISGKAATQSGTPLSGIGITLLHSSVVQTSTTTDSSGLFSMTQVVTLTPATYLDYYQIESSSATYQTITANVSMDILKATPIITYTSNNPDFGSDIIISGDVSDAALEPLALTVNLDEFVQGAWTPVASQTGPNFQFTVSNRNVGTYLFRLRIDETANYAAKITTITVDVNPAASSLSRQGLPTSIFSEYHAPVDLSIYYLDSNLSPIDGASVEVYIYNTNTDQMDLLTTVTTVNGLASVNWTPDDAYNRVGNFDFPIIYQASDPNYTPATMQISIQFVATSLTATIPQSSFGYGATPTLVIHTIDPYGYIGQQGSTVDVTIEGTVYHATINSVGELSVSHTFTSVGTSFLSLQITGAVYPYDSITATLSYFVRKGAYTIISPSVTATGGIGTWFNGTVTDNLGQPLSASVTISAYVYDTQWLLISSQSTSSSFAISFANQLIKGSYAVELRITGNTFYNTSIKQLTLDNTFEKSGFSIINAPASYLEYADPTLRSMTVQLDNFLGTHLVSSPVQYSINASTPISGTLVTDTSGQVSYTLPSYLIPGTYQITFSYAGSSTYTSASITHVFVVQGLPTTIIWTQAPVNTYQGDQLTMQVQVSDTYGSVSNFPVTFSIDGTQYNVSTNAQGIASLTIVLREPQDIVTITARANANGVWETSSISTQITQQHRQLDFTLSQPQAYYGDDVYMTISATWSGSPVANALIEIYYNQQLVFSGSTNSTGQLRLQIALPTLETGNAYLFTISVSKIDYLSVTKDQSIPVTTMPVTESLQADPAQFNTHSNITFTITDPYGNPLDGYLTVSYTDAQYTYSKTIAISGAAVMDFLPFASGTYTMQYQIFDYTNHITHTSGSFSLGIAKADAQLTADFGDAAGALIMHIHVSDGYGTELPVPIQILMDGSPFSTITGSQSVILPFGNHIITLTTASPSVNPQTHTESIYMQDLGVVVAIADTPVYDAINYTITLTGNGTLDGYVIDISVSNPSGPVYSTTVTSINGSLTASIPGTYLPDSYTIAVDIAQQGWYTAYHSDTGFLITKRSSELYITPSFLYGSRDNSITLSVSNGTGYAGISVELIGPDGSLATGITNVNGDVDLTFYYPYHTAQDTLTIRISANEYLVAGDFQLIVPVFITTQLDVSASAFTFDSGGTLNITLADGNGNPVQQGLVVVYLGSYNPDSGNYDYTMLTTAMVDNGAVLLQVDFDPTTSFTSAQIMFKVEYVNDQNYMLNTTQIAVPLSKTTLSFSYTSIDGGITNLYNVTVQLASQQVNISESMYYELRVGQSVIRSGNFIDLLSLKEDLVGNYTLYLLYRDTKPVPRYLDFSTTIPLSFSKAQTRISVVNPTLSYNGTLQLSITDATTNIPLDNVPLTITIGETSYALTTSHGLATLQLTQYPGQYGLTIVITGSSLYNQASLDTSITVITAVQHMDIASSLDVGMDQSIVLAIPHEPQGSTYQLWLDGTLLDVELHDGKFTIPQHLLPGTYDLMIERTNPLYHDEQVTITVTVHPIHLTAYPQVQRANGQLSVIITNVQLDINSLPQSESPYPIDFTIIITDTSNNQSWTFNGTQVLFNVNASISVKVQITTSIYYDYYYEKIYEVESTPTTSVSTPVHQDGGYHPGLELAFGAAIAAVLGVKYYKKRR